MEADVTAFCDALGRVFGQTVLGCEAAHAFGLFRQGSNCVFDYAIRFHTLVAKSRWNDEALTDTFYLNLSKEIKDKHTTVLNPHLVAP